MSDVSSKLITVGLGMIGFVVGLGIISLLALFIAVVVG